MTTSSAFVSTRSIPRRLLALGIAALIVALAALALAALALTLRAGANGNTTMTPATEATQIAPGDVGCLQFHVHNIRVC